MQSRGLPVFIFISFFFVAEEFNYDYCPHKAVLEMDPVMYPEQAKDQVIHLKDTMQHQKGTSTYDIRLFWAISDPVLNYPVPTDLVHTYLPGTNKFRSKSYTLHLTYWRF